MKKLIILILMLTVSPSAFSEIEDIETSKYIRVICINGYVFVKTNDSIIQMMRQSSANNQKLHATPMTCEEYRLAMFRKIFEEGKD